MSITEQFRLQGSMITGPTFEEELHDGGFYYVDQVYANIHRYLPFCLKIEEILRIPEKSYGTATSKFYSDGTYEIYEFLKNTGPAMFDYEYKAEEARGGYNCDMNGTWTFMRARVFLKDDKLITALKLAFG